MIISIPTKELARTDKFPFCYAVVAMQLIKPFSYTQTTESCPKILDYAKKHLPGEGILKSTQNFVYVDIDDAYIHDLISFLKEDGFEEPKYFGTSDLVGAHITVIYPDEIKEYGAKGIAECGEKIPFAPKECKIAHPPQWEDNESVYFIVIDAPELDQIREKYGLPFRAHDFHITIGVKPATATSSHKKIF